MSFDKKSIAAAGAAAAALVVIAGGPAVSIASYSTVLEKARVGIEQYIVHSGGLEPGSISVAFHEPGWGLFSHDVTMVITDGEDSVAVPMKINAGYARYNIEFDLINARINRENALKFYELDDMTALEAYGTVNLLNDKLTFTSNGSFLNDDKALRALADSRAFDRFQKLQAQKALEKSKAEAQARAAAARAAGIVEPAPAQAAAPVAVARPSTPAAPGPAPKVSPYAQAQANAQKLSQDAAAAEAAATAAQTPADQSSEGTVSIALGGNDNVKATVTVDGQTRELMTRTNVKGDVIEVIISDDKNAKVQADAQNTAGAQAESAQTAQAQQAVSAPEGATQNAPVAEAAQTTDATADNAKTAQTTDAAADNAQTAQTTEAAADNAQTAQAAPAAAAEALPVHTGPVIDFQMDPSLSIEENAAAFVNLQNKALMDEDKKNHELLKAMAAEEYAKLVKETGFKNSGSFTLSLNADTAENIHTNISVDSFHRDGSGFTNLNLIGENTGIVSVRSLGRGEAAIGQIYQVEFDKISRASDVVLKASGNRPDAKGMFDLNYLFKTGTYNEFRDINVSGKVKGLNLDLFNNKEGSIYALGDLIERSGMGITFDKGSSYVQQIHSRASKWTPVEVRDVTVNFDGELNLPKDSSSFLMPAPSGKINIDMDVDVTTVADPAFISDPDVIKSYNVENGRSTGVLEFTKDEEGMLWIKLNGNPVF